MAQKYAEDVVAQRERGAATFDARQANQARECCLSSKACAGGSGAEAVIQRYFFDKRRVLLSLFRRLPFTRRR